jgi:hypothetical protein
MFHQKLKKISIQKITRYATMKFSRTSFGDIVSEDHDNVTVRNEAGLVWTVSRSIFDAEFTVADRFDTEIRVNQTELIDKILKHPRTAMTVYFHKKPDPARVTQTLREFLTDKDHTSKKFASAVKIALAGEPRTMVGRHYSDLDDRGRLRFYEDGEIKLVDPRTVESAIICGKRYYV